MSMAALIWSNLWARWSFLAEGSLSRASRSYGNTRLNLLIHLHQGFKSISRTTGYVSVRFDVSVAICAIKSTSGRAMNEISRQKTCSGSLRIYQSITKMGVIQKLFSLLVFK